MLSELDLSLIRLTVTRFVDSLLSIRFLCLPRSICCPFLYIYYIYIGKLLYVVSWIGLFVYLIMNALGFYQVNFYVELIIRRNIELPLCLSALLYVIVLPVIYFPVLYYLVQEQIY